jgi:hypothetical protein
MKAFAMKMAAAAVFINALGQLAGSQVHILAITKIFANEIGFYLFLFILCGLVTAFNVFLLETRKGLFFFIVSSWATAVAGYIYVRLMQTDVAAQERLSMAEVQASWTLVILSIGIYLIGSLIIPALGWRAAGSTST